MLTRTNNSHEVPARGNKFILARYILVILASLSLIVVYGIQLELSIPAGARDMVSTAKSKKEGLFKSIMKWIPVLNNETCRSFSTSGVENATTGWSEPLHGTLFSSYLLGYIISQIPAAYVAERISAKSVMIFSLSIHVLCLILMSVADQLHCSLMYIIRIGEGVAGGVTIPAIHVLLANWSPTNELNWMSSLIYSGTSLGIAFSILSTGYTLLLGTVAVLLIIGYVYLIQDSPNKQPLISLTERNYINSSSKTSDESSTVPWSDVITSKPFIAILVAHTCFYWGWYTCLFGASSYFEQQFDFNFKENAITSVSLFTMWTFSLVLGRTLDSLCETGTVTTTVARKIATSIASIVPIICLLLLCFVTNDKMTTGIVIGIAVTSLGGIFSGFLINHIDIAPNYAGTLMAITNTFATIPGFIVPLFIDAMGKENHTVNSWRIIFFVAIAFYSIGIFVYLIFGSGKEEPWNGTNSAQIAVSYSRTKDETTPFRAGPSKY